MPDGPVILRVVRDAAAAVGTRGAGTWLRSWDLEARGGRGMADLTDDPAKAHVFASQMDAFEAWRAQSKTVPTRPDGRPNRPLTAFTVTFEPAPGAVADEPPAPSAGAGAAGPT